MSRSGMTTKADRRSIVERLFRALEDQDWEHAASLYRPDATIRLSSGEVKGRDWIAHDHQTWAHEIGRFRHNISQYVEDATGDRAVVEFEVSAHPAGQGERYQSEIRVFGCHVFTFEGETIGSDNFYIDSSAVLRQSGWKLHAERPSQATRP